MKEIVEMVQYYERKIAILDSVIKELQLDNESLGDQINELDRENQKLKEDGE